MIYSADVI